MPNEFPGYWCYWFRGPYMIIVLDFPKILIQTQFSWVGLCFASPTRRCDDFNCLQRSGYVGRQERVWTAWASWASREEICDANDLLVFSWEQKGLQYGEPNRIHYLTISSKLMQDCASECALRERVPDSLRWAGTETSTLAVCRKDFFPVCQYTLNSENGQRPLRGPLQFHFLYI